MSEKKRKRREDGGERPKKKVAIAPQGTVQVQLVENKGSLGPLLGMRKAVQDISNGYMLIQVQPLLQVLLFLRAYPSTLTSTPRSSQKAQQRSCFSSPRNTPV
jgi:hypothetical protein